MDYVLKSGAKLTVSRSSFEVGIELKERFVAAKNEGRHLLGDPEIRRMFFVCAQAAIYCGAKVTPALFDDPKLGDQARSDYDEIFNDVLEVNLAHFFHLTSSSSSIPAPNEA
jgi:hypothetical protein